MASHIFITTRHLDQCIKTGLFGVTAQQVNYLANTSPGDTVFLLETETGRIAGPFSVDSFLFFSPTPIWGQPDRFTYRVRLAGHQVWEADVSALWNILLRRRTSEFFNFTTFQRSCVGLIGDEGKALAEELQRLATHSLTPGTATIDEQPIDLLQRDRRFFTSEARLEASLLLAKAGFLDFLREEGHLPRNASPTVLNQVTLPGLNYNVDILLLSEALAIVIELKKDQFEETAASQLKRYGRYWKACGLEIRLIGIGSAIGYTDPSIAGYSYTIDRSRKVLCLEGKDKRWELPVWTASDRRL